jgi:GTP cyclohydrolase IA
MSENVIELHSPLDLAEPREVSAEDWGRFRRNAAEILAAFGLPLDTPGTRDTPERFLRALYDATSGYDGDPKLVTTFPSESTGALREAPAQVVEGPIEFSALCEHHALPFVGHAHVGYVAGEQIIGISKLTRLVRLFARRFTVQERLGEQIADTLAELVDAEGVAVRLEASHLCTLMRGVEERSRTTTTAWRGVYRDADLRREFLELAR